MGYQFTPRGYSYDQNMKETYGREPRTEYKRFSEEYFTGSDIRIYFGDEWVDEVTSLSFNVSENVQPIYGYASFTYDAVARGARQIQGQFSINFKESYYLQSITNRLEINMRKQKEGKYKNTTSKYKEFNDQIGVDQLLQESKIDPESFEKYASMYEQSLWGESSSQSMATRTNDRSHNSFFAPKEGRENIAKDGFSIMVLYGPTVGLDSSYSDNKENVARTVHSLVGVQITGVTQQIDSSGNPIQEVYNFIARDIDWNINLEK